METYLIDSLPIQINGSEKFATGLTKKTTIEDVKYAILSCSFNSHSHNSNEAINLNDYAIFERWQGNERILDSNIKVYKLIRLWKSLPGNQLDNVKFIIKKRKATAAQFLTKHIHNTASPSMCKTWNSNKAANALRKSSKSRRQREESTASSSSSPSRDSSPVSSEESSASNGVGGGSRQRYSSIRKFNRSKKSVVTKSEDRRDEFLSLVTKQNEILEKQKTKIESSDKLIKKCVQNCLKSIRSVSTTRSKSLDKTQRKQQRERSSSIRRLVVKDAVCEPEVTTSDIKSTFENVLDDKQLKEYASLCSNYFKLQKNVTVNKNRIEELNSEVQTIETNNKIQTSLQTYDKQNEKLLHLNDALNRIDEIILLKSNLIKSLECELQKIEDEQLHDLKNQGGQIKVLPTVNSSSTISSFSSASSILTSVSEQMCNNKNTSDNRQTTKFNNHMSGDNDSDTGISSANSDDCQSQLETLV